MPDEPNQVTPGVEAEQGTAPQPGGVPPTAPAPTAEPKPTPVNLDDLPEFRKYKSVEQQRTAELQRQMAELQRQAAEAQRAAQVAAYNAEVAGKDDYEKAQIALQYASRDNQTLQQQIQQMQYYQQQTQLAEKNRRQFVADAEARAKKFSIELTPQVKDEILSSSSPAEAAEVVSAFLLSESEKRVEQARVEERKRSGADNVDVGAGAPSSPDADERREREQYVQGNDVGGLIFAKMRRAVGTR